MKVLFDDNGFITSFVVIGDLVDGVNVSDPEDISHFYNHFSAYKIKDGTLVFDDEQDVLLKSEEDMCKYRLRREKECFPIINRGKLWYDTLTDVQITELNDWYHNWLDGTPTLSAPEKPIWLK